jgi:hypothetical protein
MHSDVFAEKAVMNDFWPYLSTRTGFLGKQQAVFVTLGQFGQNSC